MYYFLVTEIINELWWKILISCIRHFLQKINTTEIKTKIKTKQDKANKNKRTQQ